MISQQMPRIRLGSNLSMEEIGQALAFTYLSQYCDQAQEPRVFDAYSRAWGTNTIINLPSVDSTNPGATMSLWEGQGLQHCLVAMPGMSDFTALMHLMVDYGYQTVSGVTGAVFLAFANRAASMWTRLHANPRFAGMVANNRYVVTFTGHSLGAAMAEILAYRFKAAYPWKQVRCIKFASPRVGTRRWHANRNQNVKFVSVYSDRDPMHRFPFVPSSLSPIVDIASSIALGNFLADECPWRIDRALHGFSNTYRPLTNDGINAMNSAFFSHTFNNIWFDHHLGAYRLQFMHYAAQRRDALMYRFNYLEHNDENQWQKLFTPGMTEYAAMNVVDPIQPDPTRPISTDVELVANAPPQVQQVAPIIPDREAVLIDGGQDWGGGYTPSVATRPVRRVRRQ